MSKQKRTMFSFFGPACKQRKETVNHQGRDANFNKLFFKKTALKFVKENLELSIIFLLQCDDFKIKKNGIQLTHHFMTVCSDHVTY